MNDTPDEGEAAKKRVQILGFLLFLTVFGVVPYGTCKLLTSGNPTPTKVPIVVDRSEFNRAQDGMSYRAVCGIIGAEGELVSSSTLGGTRTETYVWRNPLWNGQMTAMFQDGKLVSKT